MQWHVRVAYGVEERDVDGAVFVMAGCGGDAEGFYGDGRFTENSGQSLIRYKGAVNIEDLNMEELCALD